MFKGDSKMGEIPVISGKRMYFSNQSLSSKAEWWGEIFSSVAEGRGEFADDLDRKTGDRQFSIFPQLQLSHYLR